MEYRYVTPFVLLLGLLALPLVALLRVSLWSARSLYAFTGYNLSVNYKNAPKWLQKVIRGYAELRLER